MSRKCERRASRGKGKYYPGLWDDILVTWQKTPDVFHYGVGQSTLAYAVRDATGRTWPSHHIRKQLIYAINAGFVRYLCSDEFVDNYRPEHSCTRFKLLKKGPLPMPQQPVISNVADIVEGNGKTVRENNMTTPHRIPLGTLVEIVSGNNPALQKYKGVRAYVCVRERDCDGEPLYGLTLNKNFSEENGDLLLDPKFAQIALIKISRGFSESILRVVQPDWCFVPPKGAYVIADHPITVANPSLIFQVKDIEPGITGGVTVRGEHTVWFSVNMIRMPTAEEAANLDNYHPSER